MTRRRRAKASGPSAPDSSTSRRGTDAASMRERACRRIERFLDLDPLEAIEPRALVAMTGAAPDRLAEALMPVLARVREPDLGHGGAQDADRGHLDGGTHVERAAVIGHECVERRHDGEVAPKRKAGDHRSRSTPRPANAFGHPARERLLARPREHDPPRTELRKRAKER